MCISLIQHSTSMCLSVIAAPKCLVVLQLQSVHSAPTVIGCAFIRSLQMLNPVKSEYIVRDQSGRWEKLLPCDIILQKEFQCGVRQKRKKMEK